MIATPYRGTRRCRRPRTTRRSASLIARARSSQTVVERQLVDRERRQPERRMILEIAGDPRPAVLVRAEHASVAHERVEQERRALDRQRRDMPRCRTRAPLRRCRAPSVHSTTRGFCRRGLARRACARTRTAPSRDRDDRRVELLLASCANRARDARGHRRRTECCALEVSVGRDAPIRPRHRRIVAEQRVELARRSRRRTCLRVLRCRRRARSRSRPRATASRASPNSIVSSTTRRTVGSFVACQRCAPSRTSSALS